MSGLNVLLVEDDPIDVRSVRRALAGYLHSVDLHVAAHGKEALEFLSGDASGRTPEELPNVILMDLNMPVMNGFELLSALKADRELRAIPAVVFTTSAESQDVAQSYALGAAVYLVKPLSSGEFNAAVMDFLNYWERCEFGL